MKYFWLVLFVISLCVPTALHAASFVNEPIFLSKSPVTVGQRVRIFVVLSNEETQTFSGHVEIEQNGQNIASSSTSMAANSTITVSAPWLPTTSGPHLITAELFDTSGARVQRVSRSFTVQAPIVETTASATTPQSSNTSASLPFSTTDITNSTYQPATKVEQTIGSISPILATTSAPIVRVIDSIRLSASEGLSGAITTQKKAIAVSETKGKFSLSKVFGQSAAIGESGVDSDTMMHPLRLVYVYFLMLVRFIINNAVICYLLIGIVALYVLWRVLKVVLRKRREE